MKTMNNRHRLLQAENRWMLIGVLLFVVIALLSLFLLLLDQKLPKYVGKFAFLMSTVNAGLFEWDRRKRKQLWHERHQGRLVDK